MPCFVRAYVLLTLIYDKSSSVRQIFVAYILTYNFKLKHWKCTLGAWMRLSVFAFRYLNCVRHTIRRRSNFSWYQHRKMPCFVRAYVLLTLIYDKSSSVRQIFVAYILTYNFKSKDWKCTLGAWMRLSVFAFHLFRSRESVCKTIRRRSKFSWYQRRKMTCFIRADVLLTLLHDKSSSVRQILCVVRSNLTYLWVRIVF